MQIVTGSVTLCKFPPEWLGVILWTRVKKQQTKKKTHVEKVLALTAKIIASDKK